MVHLPVSTYILDQLDGEAQQTAWGMKTTQSSTTRSRSAVPPGFCEASDFLGEETVAI